MKTLALETDYKIKLPLKKRSNLAYMMSCPPTKLTNVNR